jgi:hypothetical protein
MNSLSRLVKMKSLLFLVVAIATSNLFAIPAKKLNSKTAKKVVIEKPVPKNILNHPLYKEYLKKHTSKKSLEELKKKTMDLKQESVPLLTYVMKSKNFSDKNRWVATFLLGRIMGVKSARYLSKFATHPNWMLRLASLKTLLALKQTQYKGLYTRMLKDKAMIVRLQALETIRQLDLKELAPYVWAMLYNKDNYSGSNGSRKRGEIIRTVIKTTGELGFDKAKKPMMTMIQKKRYKDIHDELDYALTKVTGKKSPEGNISLKKHFWKAESTKEITI